MTALARAWLNVFIKDNYNIRPFIVIVFARILNCLNFFDVFEKNAKRTNGLAIFMV